MARITTEIPRRSLRFNFSFKNIALKIAAKTGELEEG